MTLTPIKANMTEIVLNDYRILFSYLTPVAAQNRMTNEIFVTTKKWSCTTSRHINQWVGMDEPTPAPQEYFDNLIAGVK